MAEAAITAPFKVGQKLVHLPTFSVVLHRTKHLGPKYATFTVPLWFNKLDLRDYLFHAYSVRILNVRSYIKLQKVTQGKPTYLNGEDNPKPQYRRWHRPKSVKRMTVELERPFQWPEAPEDFSAFNKDQTDTAEKETAQQQEAMGPTGDTVINEERRKSMREQAQALLEGRVKWRPTVDKGLSAMARR